MGTTPQKLAVLLAAVGASSCWGRRWRSSPPPRLDRAMHWYRWDPSARSMQGHTMAVGSTAVLGVVSMRELAALRGRTASSACARFPQLHAAEVSVSRAVARAGAARRPAHPLRLAGSGRAAALSMPNDPLAADGRSARRAGRTSGSSRARTSTGRSTSRRGARHRGRDIDTGVADVPDLAGKVDSALEHLDGRDAARPRRSRRQRRHRPRHRGRVADRGQRRRRLRHGRLRRRVPRDRRPRRRPRLLPRRRWRSR